MNKQETGSKQGIGCHKIVEIGNLVNEIVIVLLETAGHTKLKERIFDIMMQLKTAELERDDVMRKMHFGFMPLSEALHRLLVEWGSRAPDEATVDGLTDILSGCGLNAFADALADKFMSNR